MASAYAWHFKGPSWSSRRPGFATRLPRRKVAGALITTLAIVVVTQSAMSTARSFFVPTPCGSQSLAARSSATHNSLGSTIGRLSIHPTSINASEIMFRLATIASSAAVIAGSTAARRSRHVMRAGVSDDVLAEAKAAAEAAKLELEAAKLRAQAAELEKASAVERRQARAGRLLSGSLSGPNGEYTVAIEELAPRLKEVENVELTEAEAKDLAAAAGVRDEGRLRYEELSSDAFDVALARLVSQKRERAKTVERELAEEAARMQSQQAQQASAANQQQPQQQSGYTPGAAAQPDMAVNDDTSQNTRILSCLAYVLPIADGFQFGLLAVQLFPFLTPIFALLALPSTLLNLIPFGLGTLIFFTIWVVLSSNRDLPRLLRFNLQQALLLDIALFTINLWATAINNGVLPPEVGLVSFLGLIAAVVYCCAVNLDGKLPDGIPGISGFTKSLVDGPANFGGDEQGRK